MRQSKRGSAKRVDTFKNVEEAWHDAKSFSLSVLSLQDAALAWRLRDLSCCFWEDAGQDDHDADEVRGGPNGILSLTLARESFQEQGACDARFKENVRTPLADEP